VAENETALKELRAQEEAYNKKKDELTRTKGDESIGVVKRNKAANELDQLLAEDPLPLRRAKINQQATLRKMEKAAAPFNEASAKANAAAEVARKERAEAERTAEAAEEAKHQAEAAVAEAEKMLQDAVEFLEETKKKGGVAHGAIWWMERQLEEKRKYMPGYKPKQK
jgi:predicted unusual protein kinase regulating ubiquinone biosynthesis (AarF/ABC1/UbiB family)